MSSLSGAEEGGGGGGGGEGGNGGQHRRGERTNNNHRYEGALLIDGYGSSGDYGITMLDSLCSIIVIRNKTIDMALANLDYGSSYC